MYEYYNGILCVEAGWLYGDSGIISKYNYKNLRIRKKIRVLRRACKGTPALVEYDSLPGRFKQAIIDQFGDPNKMISHNTFADYIEQDPDAFSFFSSYRLPDGRALTESTIRQYVANSSILNALKNITLNTRARRRALGGSKGNIWECLAHAVDRLRDDQGHSLPGSPRRLREALRKYISDGYTSVIHGGHGNDNAQKVSATIERLILSLYVMPNKPYSSSVHDLYLQFLGGSVDIADFKTGEIFDRNNFYNDGQPVTLSDSTIWNYINDPKNRAVVDKFRSGSLQYNAKHRPFHHRKPPQFALSKISLDDRDLPRKTHEKTRVKAYYAYDVASGYLLGAAYSRNKDTDLFVACLRDMFRNIHNMNLGMPMQVEVEHHLVNKFKDDFMRAGVLFPFVRWCNPGNSQEKWSETGIRLKKLGYEKLYQDGIGRFYAKREADRVDKEKVFDAENNNYKDKTYDFDQLIADDKATIQIYNNDLHPNQKRWPGMTRRHVLLGNVNPQLANIDLPLLARYLGEHTETTIRRNQYLQVRHSNYRLPTPDIIDLLSPNDYSVNAYWLPRPDGLINNVYIYQDDKYLADCPLVEQYNTASAEQTDDDGRIYLEQSKYVSQFDSKVKKAAATLARVELIPNDIHQSVIARSDSDEAISSNTLIVPEPEPDIIEYKPLNSPNSPENSL